MSHNTTARKGRSALLCRRSCSSRLNRIFFCFIDIEDIEAFDKEIYMCTDGVVTVGMVTVGQTNPGSDSTSLRIPPAELTGLA